MTKSNDQKPGESEPAAPGGAKETDRPADLGSGSPVSKIARRKTSTRRRPTARAKPQRKIT
jgi:hypothetical protein